MLLFANRDLISQRRAPLLVPVDGMSIQCRSTVAVDCRVGWVEKGGLRDPAALPIGLVLRAVRIVTLPPPGVARHGTMHAVKGSVRREHGVLGRRRRGAMRVVGRGGRGRSWMLFSRSCLRLVDALRRGDKIGERTRWRQASPF